MYRENLIGRRDDDLSPRVLSPTCTNVTYRLDVVHNVYEYYIIMMLYG